MLIPRDFDSAHRVIKRDPIFLPARLNCWTVSMLIVITKSAHRNLAVQFLFHTILDGVVPPQHWWCIRYYRLPALHEIAVWWLVRSFGRWDISVWLEFEWLVRDWGLLAAGLATLLILFTDIYLYTFEVRLDVLVGRDDLIQVSLHRKFKARAYPRHLHEVSRRRRSCRRGGGCMEWPFQW